ncbi:AMP-binding protein [Zhouia spongiae]|uniref:AMP-binding protein n=1 Tax=Zhouia spongiae TaxID=2202721 RepID=A0ABY3YJV2_9FLAO|nr:AMP-binding protein [Zhouia spongiae]UNY97973.1 AMP-binding protein [Zhouia spongiae]
MIPSFDKLHNRFKLNGHHYNREELVEAAYSFVKEGAEYENIIGDFLLDWLSASDEVSVHTSGSTGTPKQISLKKKHMVNSAIATGDFFGLKPGNTSLLCLPANYIAGKMMLVRAMILGLEIECVEPGLQPIKNIEKHYDFVPMIPAQVENSLDKIELIDQVIIGGAAVGKQLFNNLQSKSTRFYSTYGMTETITHIAVKRLNPLNGKQTHFKSLPKVFLSTDTRGCLVINAPKLSDEAIVTNDVVNLISETEFEWLGRIDNVINSGGVKLFPEQIEAKLADLIANRFFVASEKNETLGEQLILVIEGTEIDKDQQLKNIKNLKTITKLEVPKEIYTIPEFTESENGKVLRSATLKLI